MLIPGVSPLVEKIILFVFFFAFYWFVLRKYNSLGFRMFSLFFFVSLAGAYWIWQDEQVLKGLQQGGQAYEATVLEKFKAGNSNTSSPDNAFRVSFKTTDGTILRLSTSEYVSQEEWDSTQVNQQIKVLYDPKTEIVYVAKSVARFQNDRWILYVCVAFFLVLGVGIGWYFRKIKVGVHEDTGDEYLEENGKIILDERNSPAAQTAKRVNIVSKMWQIFKP